MIGLFVFIAIAAALAAVGFGLSARSARASAHERSKEIERWRTEAEKGLKELQEKSTELKEEGMLVIPPVDNVQDAFHYVEDSNQRDENCDWFHFESVLLNGNGEVVDEEAVLAGGDGRRDGRVDRARGPARGIRGVRGRDVARGLVGEADEEPDDAGRP